MCDQYTLSKTYLPFKKINAIYYNLKHLKSMKKVMLFVWWNLEAIPHFELVPNVSTINADLFCRRKRPLFQQDNARPLTPP